MAVEPVGKSDYYLMGGCAIIAATCRIAISYIHEVGFVWALLLSIMILSIGIGGLRLMQCIRDW